MASTQLIGNYTNTAIDTPEIAFSASRDTIIESFTAANTSSVNASYKAYIVPSGGDLQPQKPFQVVVWGENDLGIGIVNQVIPKGGVLRLESSALNSIYFTVTGRVL